MEQQLAFIQNQLWALIALLLIFVGGNLFCYLTRNKTDSKEQPEFGEMWDKGEIDELLNESESFLKKYPNHSSALYFRAKALIARQQYIEAKKLLNKFIINYPDFKESINELLEAIENENS